MRVDVDRRQRTRQARRLRERRVLRLQAAPKIMLEGRDCSGDGGGRKERNSPLAKAEARDQRRPPSQLHDSPFSRTTQARRMKVSPLLVGCAAVAVLSQTRAHLPPHSKLILTPPPVALSDGRTRTSQSSYAPYAAHQLTSLPCLARSSISSLRSRLRKGRERLFVRGVVAGRARALCLLASSPFLADSFLNITKAASEKEVSKAYRKRSLELQCVHNAAPSHRSLD